VAEVPPINNGLWRRFPDDITVTWNVSEWDNDATDPVTVILYLPAGVENDPYGPEEAVRIVSVATFGGRGTIWRLVGLTVTPGPPWETVVDKVTSVLNPFMLAKVIVRLTLEPCWTVMLVELDVNWKFGPLITIVVEWVMEPLTPVVVTLNSPIAPSDNVTLAEVVWRVRLTLLGVNENLSISKGADSTKLNNTVPLNPLIPVIVIVSLPNDPAWIVIEDVCADSRKSGAVMFELTSVECDAVLLLARTFTLWRPVGVIDVEGRSKSPIVNMNRIELSIDVCLTISLPVDQLSNKGARDESVRMEAGRVGFEPTICGSAGRRLGPGSTTGPVSSQPIPALIMQSLGPAASQQTVSYGTD
jgi:hypothetical protein